MKMSFQLSPFAQSILPPKHALPSYRMGDLTLAQSELLKIGPISSRHALELLPISKQKKKQKFIVCDDSGVATAYRMKRGEPQVVFKTYSLGGVINCLKMGSGKGVEDRVYIAVTNNVNGFSKKGKEFLKFQSNLSEPIKFTHLANNQLFIATDYVYSLYDVNTGHEKRTYMSQDKINDMLVIGNTSECPVILLACQDRMIRAVEKSNLTASKTMSSSVTALARVQTSRSDEQCIAAVYGTSDGELGMISFMGEKLKIEWKTRAESHWGGMVNTLCCFDMDNDGRPELLVGRDDGKIQVVRFDSGGVMDKIFETTTTDSIRTIRGGIVSTSGYREIIACTFTGRILSFTTEPLEQADVSDSKGRSRGTVQRETRIAKLKKDVAQLEDRVMKERDKSSRQKNGQFMKLADEIVMNTKFQLNPLLGAYDVSIEIPVDIHSVVLHSSVPIDLLEIESNLAVVGKSKTDPKNGTHFLATYRCLEPSHRLEFQIRTIEGQFGEIEATVLTNCAPKSAQTIIFHVKPLSMHMRITEPISEEMETPMNILHFTGPFTALQMHDWVTMCLPDVPPRLPGNDVTLYYKNAFVKDLLICHYEAEEATFRSPSVSVIAILKEVITKEATVRKVSVNMTLDMKKETTPVMLHLLRPLLDAKHALASQMKLLDGLKELQTHEEDYSAWMTPEYQAILHDAENISTNFKTSPKALHYLAGFLTDLYVDLCKFRGTNAKDQLPRLHQLIDQYHFESLLEFFMQQ